MEIRFKGYVIRRDTGRSWSLTKLMTVKDETSENFGNEYEGQSTFPFSLERCFEIIMDNEIRDKSVNLEVGQVVEFLRTEHNRFISELKEVCKTIPVDQFSKPVSNRGRKKKDGSEDDSDEDDSDETPETDDDDETTEENS